MDNRTSCEPYCVRKTVCEYYYNPCNSYFSCSTEREIPVLNYYRCRTPTFNVLRAIRRRANLFFRGLCCISISSCEDDIRVQCKDKKFKKNEACQRYECKRY